MNTNKKSPRCAQQEFYFSHLDFSKQVQKTSPRCARQEFYFSHLDIPKSVQSKHSQHFKKLIMSTTAISYPVVRRPMLFTTRCTCRIASLRDRLWSSRKQRARSRSTFVRTSQMNQLRSQLCSKSFLEKLKMHAKSGPGESKIDEK